MKCQRKNMTEHTKEWEAEKEEIMGMRKTMMKENKTATARKAQDRRSQKKSVLSSHTASHSSEDSLIPLSHYISPLFCHQYMVQAFPLYCLCFSSVFPSTTQQFVEEKIITGSWQLLSLQNSCLRPLSSQT